ncbi:hypothetical protein D3C81_1969630 [compost metagenome]
MDFHCVYHGWGWADRLHVHLRLALYQTPATMNHTNHCRGLHMSRIIKSLINRDRTNVDDVGAVAAAILAVICILWTIS